MGGSTAPRAAAMATPANYVRRFRQGSRELGGCSRPRWSVQSPGWTGDTCYPCLRSIQSPRRWLGRRLSQRRMRFDPADWGQAAPPQSPGSATPATPNPDPPDCCSSGSGLSLWLASPRPVRRCVPRFRVARISDPYRPPSRAERWSVLPSTRWLGAGCCRLAQAVAGLAQRRRRFDPAAWGQAAPPQSPGSATPATPRASFGEKGSGGLM